MVGVIEGFPLGSPRARNAPNFGVMAVGAVAVAVLLLGGLVYFKRTERTFIDHV